jgi:hypothetical protein
MRQKRHLEKFFFNSFLFILEFAQIIKGLTISIFVLVDDESNDLIKLERRQSSIIGINLLWLF